MKRDWAIALVVIFAVATPAFAAAPAQPPRAGCAAVDKREYDAARKRNMLRSRYGEYVRTGRPLRRQYWYCH